MCIKIIWFYQLSWQCKLATVKRFESVCITLNKSGLFFVYGKIMLSFPSFLAFIILESCDCKKQIFDVNFLCIDPLMYRSIPKPPMPPRANPRAFDVFEKSWSNSPLCCQFRRSNAPPIRALKRVKSPTLQACEANCGNKFCKIFSHYEFLVQIVFAPHFKQRNIPR